MKSIVSRTASVSTVPQATVSRRACSQPCRLPTPFVAAAPARHQTRRVEARFFKFGKNGFGAEDAGIVGSQGRNDYNYDDVEQYFNYMGFLAEEGTYDRMEAMLNSGLHPIDVILLLACHENDTPKVGEILKAGADVDAKDLDGRKPSQIATKPQLLDLLKEYEAKKTVSA